MESFFFFSSSCECPREAQSRFAFSIREEKIINKAWSQLASVRAKLNEESIKAGGDDSKDARLNEPTRSHTVRHARMTLRHWEFVLKDKAKPNWNFNYSNDSKLAVNYTSIQTRKTSRSITCAKCETNIFAIHAFDRLLTLLSFRLAFIFLLNLIKISLIRFAHNTPVSDPSSRIWIIIGI